MFRIAICDDERQFRKRIHDILIEYMNENDILYEIDEFESGKDFISLGINLAKYDIVFLDVNMDELDGMETAQKIRKVSNDVFIVFVTAFITCAPQGYSVGAIRYILKNNVNFPELIFECMDAISLNMNYVAQKKKFNFNEGTKIVALERLLYIESRLHKLEFYIMEDKLKKYSIYGKLDELEKELQGNDFIRIHQSYLVNMKHIEKVSRYEALLNNGIKLEIPKARYKFVEETFVSYKGELYMMIILEVICCKIFFESFAEKRSKNNYRNYSIILGIVVCEYVIASLFYDKFILKQILAIVAVAVFMCFYFKIHFGKAIILSLLFQALLLSVDYFTLWLNVSLFDSIAEISRLHFVGGSLITVLGKIILFLVVLLIRKKVGGESSDVLRSTDWLRFIFFPVFTIFTVIALIMTFGNIENQKQENVFLVIALCLAGMNIVVFYMINDILKREIKIRENEVFQLKARNQTDMYRSISENFVKQRKKTHEYKNQIMCIESLIEMENYDELKDYVKSISGNLSTELDYIKTNNVIIDAILNSKYKETLDKGIVFIFQINDLSGIKMCDEDIVVILSNLLNNAIEACEKCSGKKFMKMKLVKEKDNIIISVKNTYDGKLNIKDGEIQTSKKYEMDEHGVGIKNIIEVITKYQGSYAIRNDNNEFYFSVILPN